MDKDMTRVGQGAAIVACHAKPAQCGKTPRCEARILNSQLNIDGSGPFGGFDGRLPCGEGFLTMPPPALRRDAGDMLLTSSGSSPGFAATAKGFAPASLSFFFLSSLPLSFVAAMATASVVSHLESKRRRGRRRDQRLGGGTAAPPPPQTLFGTHLSGWRPPLGVSSPGDSPEPAGGPLQRWVAARAAAGQCPLSTARHESKSSLLLRRPTRPARSPGLLLRLSSTEKSAPTLWFGSGCVSGPEPG